MRKSTQQPQPPVMSFPPPIRMPDNDEKVEKEVNNFDGAIPNNVVTGETSQEPANLSFSTEATERSTTERLLQQQILELEETTKEAPPLNSEGTTEPLQQQQQQQQQHQVLEPEETFKEAPPLNSEEALSIPADPSGEEAAALKEDNKKLEPGDHVFTWCSVLGIPGVFQHHGIVIHAEDIIIANNEEKEEGDDEEYEQLLTIADFSNLLLPSGRGATMNTANSNASTNSEDGTAEETATESQSSYENETVDSSERSSDRSESPPCPTEQPTGSLSGGTPLLRSGSSTANVSNNGCLRVYRTASTKKNRWRKVQYQDRWVNIHLRKRSGTCTASPSDPPEVVMKRVNFLLQQSKLDVSSSVLPKYHSIFANCECVAVWCKTGTWSTLQASSFLSHAAVGQVKGTAVIATAAASAQATVPAAGMMGWLGFTTTVPLMSVQPFLLPAICAYGAVTIGGPAAVLAYAKSSWKETTKRLNEALDSDSLEVALVT